jgi:F0F1-type ATP synthase assembly protein I
LAVLSLRPDEEFVKGYVEKEKIEGEQMDPSSSRGIGKYTSLALLLPLSTLIGYAMGYGVDLLFHTTWIRYVFLVLGTISGFISLIRELDKDK